MTILEAALLAVVAALIVSMFLFTLGFFRALQAALNYAESVHIRSQAFQDKLLDRLMAVDYTRFRAYSDADSSPSGGWEAPERQPTEAEILDRMAVGEDTEEITTVTGLRLRGEGETS